LSQVSVITIVKNDSRGLEDSIQSLLDQSFQQWEQIIVVGESKDETLAIARNYSQFDSRIKFLKQAGSGIYSAMNQGVYKAKGEFLWFMNSGDIFFEFDSLEFALGEIQKRNVDLFLGGYSLRTEKSAPYLSKSRLISPSRFSLNVRSGCHQAMLFTNFYKKYGLTYDENYEIAGDFDLILRILKFKNAYRTDRALARILPGGVSDKRIRYVFSEKQISRRNNFGVFSGEYFLGWIWTQLVKSKISLRKFRLSILKGVIGPNQPLN
jgi:glycosyltransferase involved in cell wall biosynthesis